MNNIKIGTIVNADKNSASYVKQIIPCGFESFVFTYSGGNFAGTDPEEVADGVMPILREKEIGVSAISLFGDMLGFTDEADETRRCFRRTIDCAQYFGTGIVSGFTGRLVGKSVPDCIERFKEVWTPICEYAKEKGVRIAFENCSMGGSWHTGGKFNIALNPDAWELMFEAVPIDNIGLQWEPCHQLLQGIDPIPQIREWAERIFHVHGKDATVRKDILSRHGIMSPVAYQWDRAPGFGDSNWTDIISELRFAGYQGNIDIEGWHDPVYRGDLEMTGQVAGLNYLKRCRGEAFIPNPVL